MAVEMMAMQPTVKAEAVTYKALPQLLWAEAVVVVVADMLVVQRSKVGEAATEVLAT